MKEITIVAHTGIGKDRVKVGEKKVKIPTTFAEIKSGKFPGWDEQQTMDDAESSYVIREQRAMRPSSGGLTEEEKALLAEFRAKKSAPKKRVVRNPKREARENRQAVEAAATEEVK